MTDPNGPIPEFAILGHPNEGKSTLVSTLTEDDTVRVSPFPGETTTCRSYTVSIGKTPLIRFVDTPGFQSPRKALAWFQRYSGPSQNILEAFLESHKASRSFRDECQLLSPVAKGAGIIYVADGSRPLRKNDLAEMEILRLTGLPRMAVINCKGKDERHLASWRAEFRKTFNAVRVFNAQSASIKDRQELLTALMGVDPEWQPALKKVIDALTQEWQSRIELCSAAIAELLHFALTHTVKAVLHDEKDSEAIEKRLTRRFHKEIEKKERNTRDLIRRSFRHTLFDVDLPQGSILTEDLFGQRNLKFLGLTRYQLTTAAATCGAAAGAAIDLAAAGLSFGVFTLIGSVSGAASVLLSQKQIAKTKISGVPLGGQEITLGPCRNLQVIFILLDRIYIYFKIITSRAHGKRDELALSVEAETLEGGSLSRQLNVSETKTIQTLFEKAEKKDQTALHTALDEVKTLLASILTKG